MIKRGDRCDLCRSHLSPLFISVTMGLVRIVLFFKIFIHKIIDVVNGNMAAAIGAALAKPDVIAAYSITPQTPVVEYLTQFRADGKIDTGMSEVESELSAMSVVTGASLAGSRTFTATASQGLALMYEPYFRASTLRLPIVMAIVNREMISPQSVWGGQQDSMSVRDAGWLQIYAEDNQEIKKRRQV